MDKKIFRNFQLHIIHLAFAMRSHTILSIHFIYNSVIWPVKREAICSCNFHFDAIASQMHLLQSFYRRRFGLTTTINGQIENSK